MPNRPRPGLPSMILMNRSLSPPVPIAGLSFIHRSPCNTPCGTTARQNARPHRPGQPTRPHCRGKCQGEITSPYPRRSVSAWGFDGIGGLSTLCRPVNVGMAKGWRKEDENEPEQTQTWYSPVLLEHGLRLGWSKSRMVEDGAEGFAVSPDAVASSILLPFSILAVSRANMKMANMERQG